MTDRSTRRLGSAGLLVLAALAACAPEVSVHGYVPSEAAISRITPGDDDRATVEEVLGRPSSSGLLQDNAWYYVQSTMAQETYKAPVVVDRTVLAVFYDANDRVAAIDRYGVEDGRIVNLQTRTTETGGRQLGVLEQLFGNLLNIDAEQILGDN